MSDAITVTLYVTGTFLLIAVLINVAQLIDALFARWVKKIRGEDK